MKLTETAVVMTVTLSTVAVAATQFDLDQLSRRTTVTAARATCHTVETAIAAYAAEWGSLPTAIVDIRPYVQGDITAYRIDRGHARGPGCVEPPA